MLTIRIITDVKWGCRLKFYFLFALCMAEDMGKGTEKNIRHKKKLLAKW